MYLKKLISKTLLVAAMLGMGTNGVWAYNIPSGWGVANVFIGTQNGNTVTAEDFSSVSSVPSGWALNFTPGHSFTKMSIGNVTEVNKPEIGSGVLTEEVDDGNGGTTTVELIPTYVSGKTLQFTMRENPADEGKAQCFAEYSFAPVSTGKLVFSADLFANGDNVYQPIIVKFADKDNNVLVTLNWDNGGGLQYYRWTTDNASETMGARSTYRTYPGFGLYDVVLDLETGAFEFSVDHIADRNSPKPRTVSTKSVTTDKGFGSGHNIAKVLIGKAPTKQATLNVHMDNVVLYQIGQNHNYTVNAVVGGTILQTLTTGTAAEGQAYSVTGVPAVIEKNGMYYRLSDVNVVSAQESFTMGDDDEVQSVNYVEDDTILFFGEFETLSPSSISNLSTNTSIRAFFSNGQGRSLQAKSTSSTNAMSATYTFNVASEGVYKITMPYYNGNSSNRTTVITVDLGESNAKEILNASIPKNGGSGTVDANVLLSSGDHTITVAGTYNLTAEIDYILISKIYDITGEVVGAVDFTTAANAAKSSDYTLSQGETKVITFQNHGTTLANNWRLFVTEGETVKSITRADSWDETAGAATALSYQVSKDGGNTKTNLNWDEFAADMADANVVAKLTYGTDGTLTIKTEATGAANGYIYYVNQSVSGLTNDLTINLSVCNSWLEVLSVETPQKNTYTATFYNDANWGIVKAFAWTTEGNVTDNYLGAWPGTEINGENGVYTLTFQAVDAPANIIFNNGGSGNQTSDLAFEDGASYCSSGKVLYTAYYQDIYNWGTVYGYAWSGDGASKVEQLGAWNGTQLRKFGNYYTAFITNATMPECIIFHKGDGNNKTGDLAFVDGATYSYNGVATVPAKIGATGYTTFASTQVLDLTNLPTGLQAFYAYGTDNDNVKFREVETEVVAGTGLLLKGTANTTYSIPVVSTGDAVSGNLLVGCTTATQLTANANYYVMVNNGGTAEFQSLDQNGANIPAGKAYLNVSGAGARLSFSFDDETTRIGNVNVNLNGNKVYNLNGQRVNNPTKGMYIVNGKKVIIK